MKSLAEPIFFMYRLISMSASILFLQIMFNTWLLEELPPILKLTILLGAYFAIVSFIAHFRGLRDPFSAETQ
jgi:hypothetical protein